MDTRNDGAALQPKDTQGIKQHHRKPVPKTVFGLSGGTRPMIDRKFQYPIAMERR